MSEDSPASLSEKYLEFATNCLNFIKSHKFRDVPLKFGDRSVKVRGEDLLSKSKYFELLAIHSPHPIETLEYPESLDEAFPDLTLSVVEFIQGRGSLIDHVSEENVLETYIIADFLGLDDLVDICDEKIRHLLTPSNVTHNTILVERLPFLRKKLIDYASRVFEIDLANNVGLSKMARHTFEELLSHNDLRVDKEYKVWEAIRNWGRDKDKTEVADLVLQHVKLGLMGPDKYRELNSYFEGLVGEGVRKELQSVAEFQDWKHAPGDLDLLYENEGFDIQPKFVQPREAGPGILVTGGFTRVIDGDNDETVLSESMELFDIANMTWFSLPKSFNLFKPRAYHRTAIIGDHIYILGGLTPETKEKSFQKFDLKTLTWKDLPPMWSTRCFLSSALTGEDNIVAIGGSRGHFALDARHKSCEFFDSTENEWVELPDLSTVRSDACAVMHDGKVWVVGGFDGEFYLRSVEMFDFNEMEWQRMPNMNHQRGGVGCAVLNGRLYALGGHDGTKRLKTVEFLDLKDPIGWNPAPDMITERSNFGICSLEGIIYVVGGYKAPKVTDFCECFDGIRWCRFQNLPRAASGIALTSVENCAPYLRHLEGDKAKNIVEKRNYIASLLDNQGKATVQELLEKRYEYQDMLRIVCGESFDEDLFLDNYQPLEELKSDSLEATEKLCKGRP